MTIPNEESLYCLASSVGLGYRAKFIYGPCQEFDKAWMHDSDVIFTSNAVHGPRLAVEKMVEHAALMSKVLFAKLYTGHASLSTLEATGDGGKDVLRYVQDLATILKAAPWEVDDKKKVRARAPVKVPVKVPSSMVGEADRIMAPSTFLMLHKNYSELMQRKYLNEDALSYANILEKLLLQCPWMLDQNKAVVKNNFEQKSILPKSNINSVRFFLAHTVSEGYEGKYIDDGYANFDGSWLYEDYVVFKHMGGGQARLAHQEMIQYAPAISQELFAKLHGDQVNFSNRLLQDAVKGSLSHEDVEVLRILVDDLTAVLGASMQYSNAQNFDAQHWSESFVEDAAEDLPNVRF